MRVARIGCFFTICLLLGFTFPPSTIASDHGDSPTNASDQAVDQGDTYAFVDPNDNGRLILILTVRGFIVPGEAVNFGFFDSQVKFQFQLETNGDVKPDRLINIFFDERQSAAGPQRARIQLPFGETFMADTTPPTLGGEPNAPRVTTDPQTGVSFFAGQVDDPFFLDIPGLSRFIASVLDGAPDATLLERGRDSFAGYNIQAIALSVPVSYLESDSRVVGVQSLTFRALGPAPGRSRGRARGRLRQRDRSATPAINAVLIPFARRDEYNESLPIDDANGRFADDIVAVLTALGTDATNIGILADVAVTNGDYLRIDTRVPNFGSGGGTNPEAAFPNGRRPADDVVDTLLFFIANQQPLGDAVDANDATFRDKFPFLAPPHQPQPNGTLDDGTRN